MSRISAAVSTFGVVLVALAVVAVGIRVADAALGGLPGGAELVGWSFTIAAVVGAVMVALWARGAGMDHPFAVSVLRGLAPFAVAGLLTVLAWYVLFYGSGQYEKAGYERLASAFALLIAAMNVSVVAAARIVARATLHDTGRIAAIVALTMLAFVGTFAVPMLI